MSDLILTDGNTSVTWFDEFFKIGYDSVVVKCDDKYGFALAMYFLMKFAEEKNSEVNLYPCAPEELQDSAVKIVDLLRGMFPNVRVHGVEIKDPELKSTVSATRTVNTQIDIPEGADSEQLLRKPWVNIQRPFLAYLYDQENLGDNLYPLTR